MRTTAYQKTVVMKYIDTLIAWGDQLFRRDTLETINEATQIYVLAANILGRRPVEPPPCEDTAGAKPSIRCRRASTFSNALAEIEDFVPSRRASRAAANPRRRRRRCCISASRRTTSCSATGTPWPIGCSRSGTA